MDVNQTIEFYIYSIAMFKDLGEFDMVDELEKEYEAFIEKHRDD